MTADLDFYKYQNFFKLGLLFLHQLSDQDEQSPGDQEHRPILNDFLAQPEASAEDKKQRQANADQDQSACQCTAQLLFDDAGKKDAQTHKTRDQSP